MLLQQTILGIIHRKYADFLHIYIDGSLNSEKYYSGSSFQQCGELKVQKIRILTESKSVLLTLAKYRPPDPYFFIYLWNVKNI